MSLTTVAAGSQNKPASPVFDVTHGAPGAKSNDASRGPNRSAFFGEWGMEAVFSVQFSALAGGGRPVSHAQ
jgi:hypothetical protein